MSAATGRSSRVRADSPWLPQLGVRAGYLSGVLGLVGFGLLFVAPREQTQRATDPLWLTTALVSWASLLLALIFLCGLAAAATRPSRLARAAWVATFLATAAGSARHTRVMVDYAAHDIDPAFAARLHDTQTPLAEGIFAVIALTALAGWATVAFTLGTAAHLSTTGKAALAVAGLGIMLAIPITAVALLVASHACARSVPPPQQA